MDKGIEGIVWVLPTPLSGIDVPGSRPWTFSRCGMSRSSEKDTWTVATAADKRSSSSAMLN